MQERYWVIGGEYETSAFDRLLNGTEQIMGPYQDQEDARRAWEAIATETRCICNARFTIVREGSALN